MFLISFPESRIKRQRMLSESQSKHNIIALVLQLWKVIHQFLWYSTKRKKATKYLRNGATIEKYSQIKVIGHIFQLRICTNIFGCCKVKKYKHKKLYPLKHGSNLVGRRKEEEETRLRLRRRREIKCWTTLTHRHDLKEFIKIDAHYLYSLTQKNLINNCGEMN